MMKEQTDVFEKLSVATDQLAELWSKGRDHLNATGVPEASILETRNQLGGVRNNLRNFSRFSFLSDDSLTLSPEDRERLNEVAWQENQADPRYHQNLRTFFPNQRIPTSMDMTRLGEALLAEANLLRLTNVPIATDELLDPLVDPIAVAHQIATGPIPVGHSKEWAIRIGKILEYRCEDDLRADPNFSIFVAAVKKFLDH